MVKVKLNAQQNEFISKLYSEQADKLYKFAVGFLEPSSAEEAVQNPFRDACLKIDDIMASENPVGWLTKALKFSISKIKREKRQFVRFMLLVPPHSDSDNNIEIGIEEVIDPNPPDEDVDSLYPELAVLEEFQLIKEYAVEDKSIKEMADKRGISISACKQKLYRCRLKLRKKLEEEDKKS